MATLTTTSSKLCRSARERYHARKKAFDGLPTSSKHDTPLTAYTAYLLAMRVYNAACRWSDFGTYAGICASKISELQADFAYTHYTYQTEIANEKNAVS